MAASITRKEAVQVVDPSLYERLRETIRYDYGEDEESKKELLRNLKCEFACTYPRHVEKARLLGCPKEAVEALSDLVGDDPVKRVAVLDKDVYATFPLPGEKPQRGLWACIKRACGTVWRFLTGRGGAQARAQRQKDVEERSRRHVY